MSSFNQTTSAYKTDELRTINFAIYLQIFTVHTARSHILLYDKIVGSLKIFVKGILSTDKRQFIFNDAINLSVRKTT